MNTDQIAKAQELATYNRGDYAPDMREIRPLAEQDDVEAQLQLGFMYGNGVGVPKNDAQAVKWFHKAAEQDHEDAMRRLSPDLPTRRPKPLRAAS
jgi:hypothetical protein